MALALRQVLRCHNVCYIYTNTQCRHRHERLRFCQKSIWDQLESKSVTLACAGNRRGLHTLGVRVNAKATRFTQFVLANVAEHLENPNKSNPCFKDMCFYFFSLCDTSWACVSSFRSYFDQICISVSTKQIHL